MSSKRAFDTSNEIFNIAKNAKINPYQAFCQFYLRELVALITQIDKSIVVYGGISTAIHAEQYNRVVSDLDFSMNGNKNDLQNLLNEINKKNNGLVKFTGFMGREIASNPKTFNLNFKTKFKSHDKVIAADAKLDKVEYEYKPLPRFTSSDRAISVRTTTLDEHIASKVKALFSVLYVTGKLREQDVYDIMFLIDKCKLDIAAIADRVHKKIKQDEITKGKFTSENIESAVDSTNGILRPVTPLIQTPMSRPVVLQNAKKVLNRFVRN